MHNRGPRRRERESEKGPEDIFEEKVAKSFSNMGKETVRGPRRRERESKKGPEEIFAEKVAKSFSNMGKETVTQV